MFQFIISVLNLIAAIYLSLLVMRYRRRYVMAASFATFVKTIVIREPHRWSAAETKFLLDNADWALNDPIPLWKFWAFPQKKDDDDEDV